MQSQVEEEMTTDELVALVSEVASSVSDGEEVVDEPDGIEDVVTAPSLVDMRQQLKGFAAFMADNPQFTAQDELFLQRFSNKVAKMLVARVNHRQQQSITDYFNRF